MFSIRKRPHVLFIMPPCLPTPPVGYGGIEAVAAALIPELRRAGAHITLTTPNGSTVEADAKHEITEPLYSRLSSMYNFIAPDIELYVTKVMHLAWKGDFDVIHDFSGMFTVVNTLAGALPSGKFPPVVQTIHGPVGPFVPHYENLVKYGALRFTAISNAQLTDAPGAVRNRSTVIYNGVKPSEFKLGAGGDRLLVLGRLCQDKGQDRLVDFVKQSDLKLDIAGTVAEMSTIAEIDAELELGNESRHAQHPDLKLYRDIKPHIDGDKIRFFGNVAGSLKEELLGGSAAMVMPNRWAEPFGMVAIEAMASGTPVVAMGTGALPELIVHGVTGYLAESFEELTHFLDPKMIARLDRAKCREHVEKNFSTTALAKQYVNLYTQMIEKTKPLKTARPAKVGSSALTISSVFGEQIIQAKSRQDDSIQSDKVR